jgi:hypothetical protein
MSFSFSCIGKLGKATSADVDRLVVVFSNTQGVLYGSDAEITVQTGAVPEIKAV